MIDQLAKEPSIEGSFASDVLRDKEVEQFELASVFVRLPLLTGPADSPIMQP